LDAVQSDRFILANITNNNNKFWNITRYSNNVVATHYGRVGETGQTTEKNFYSEGAAISFYEGKCREKTGKGYVPQRTIEATGTVEMVKPSHDLREVAKAQITSASPAALQLIEYLAKANVHSILSSTKMTYDTNRGTFSTPLGIVTQDAIDEARNLLIQISDFVAIRDQGNSTLTPLLNQYLMLIPQDIGRSRPDPYRLYPDLSSIQRQNDLLDSLEASLQMVLSAPAPTAVAGIDVAPPKLFDCSLEIVEDGKEIDRIRRKYRETQQSVHLSSALDVKTVYLIEIGAMRRTFEQDGAKLTNIWELWHGSKKGNLLSILAKGFVIPPQNAPHCTGRMFGNGCYFSDQSTKSLNYAAGYWDGNRDDNCFMFLANVAMGNYYVPPRSMQNLPQPGYDSTYAQANKSGVMNNEMIVYRPGQIDPVFLVEFSKGGR
jgi:poly [ADP-ribose] polymerase